MQTIEEKQKGAFEALKEKQGYTNLMEVPRVEKVVVSVGVGSFRDNKEKVEVVEDRLTRLTGQKPSSRGAKQSIASFKTREGDKIGYQVTLRGKRMYAFLDKLLNIALPRTKDFRGIPQTAIDEMGNYTVGISEHTIFPETSDEDIKNVFGLAVTVVTTAESREEAKLFLEHLGFPFNEQGAVAA